MLLPNINTILNMDIQEINYPAYKNYLDKNFKNSHSFYQIWKLYLQAQKLLAD